MKNKVQINTNDNILTITSKGVIQIEPNIAIVTIGARTENKQASLAQTDNAKTINKIINSMLQQGIKADEIQTTEFRMNIHYDYNEGIQKFRGYEVEHLLQVTIKDTEKIGELLDLAVKNGANLITNLFFTIENNEKLYNEALVAALNKAKIKAGTIAKTLNVNLNPTPLSITELNSDQQFTPLQVSSFAKTEATSMLAGQVNIDALIKVQFLYH